MVGGRVIEAIPAESQTDPRGPIEDAEIGATTQREPVIDLEGVEEGQVEQGTDDRDPGQADRAGRTQRLRQPASGLESQPRVDQLRPTLAAAEVLDIPRRISDCMSGRR